MSRPSDLPIEFLDSIATQLSQEEVQSFLQAMDLPSRRAMRLMKASPSEFRGWEPLEEGTGFFLPEGFQPAHCPLHASGGYYVQEPSAMQVVRVLEGRRFSRILDLCAAPGGKTLQLLGSLDCGGLLVANELHRSRVRALKENLERAGSFNTVIYNTSPDELAKRYTDSFDLILCDAPCSGEGMFRKNPATRLEWSPEQVEVCFLRQKQILDSALKMLHPGGLLLYSTCTFNTLENEGVVEFLEQRGLRLIRSRRLWPHRHQGEGHFMALLQKAGEMPEKPRESSQFACPDCIPAKLADWLSLRGSVEIEKGVCRFYPLGLQKREAGLYRGSIEVGRTKPKAGFVPSHALAMALKPSEFEGVEVGCRKQALRFLRGETLSMTGEGLQLVSYRGVGMGWQLNRKGRARNLVPRAVGAFLPLA